MMDEADDPYGLIKPDIEVFEDHEQPIPAGKLSYKAVKAW